MRFITSNSSALGEMFNLDFVEQIGMDSIETYQGDISRIYICMYGRREKQIIYESECPVDCMNYMIKLKELICITIKE
jgi:hypothetical protein